MQSSANLKRLPAFTLVELLVVLAVISTLILVVIPSFSTTIKNNRLYRQVNDLQGSLMRARSEALTRAQRVTVCASDNQTSCTGNWAGGWIIFIEGHDSQNASVEDSNDILEVYGAINGGNTIKGSTDVSMYISYIGTGYTAKAVSGYPPQSGFLAICDSRGANYGKAIHINAAGRPRAMSVSDTVSGSCAP